MKKYNLNDFSRGWFAGFFEPSIINTKDFELGIKRYSAGAKEEKHFHKLAQEITIIISGEVLMNGVKYNADDIIVIEPNETTDFEALTDVVTFVYKSKSVIGDKYICE